MTYQEARDSCFRAWQRTQQQLSLDDVLEEGSAPFTDGDRGHGTGLSSSAPLSHNSHRGGALPPSTSTKEVLS